MRTGSPWKCDRAEDLKRGGTTWRSARTTCGPLSASAWAARVCWPISASTAIACARYDKDDAQVAGIRAAKGLHVDGTAAGKVRARRACDHRCRAAARRRASAILVSVNGDDHEPLARDLAPHLKDGQIVVLIQGHFCGTLVVPERAEEGGVQGQGRGLRARRLPLHDDGARTRSRRADLRQGDDAARGRAGVPLEGHRQGARPSPFRGLQPDPICCRPASPISAACSMPAASSPMSGSPRAASATISTPHNMTPSVCNLIEAVDRERVAAAQGLRDR